MANSDSLLKNAFGSVRPYTRHLSSCSFEDNSCNCPKWLYEHRKDGQRKRYALNTPSFAEAQRLASEKLRSFDPDIAAAKATVAKSDAKRVTIADACQLWLNRSESTSTNWSASMYRSAATKLRAWADRNRIEYVQDITPLLLQKWYDSAEWKQYAETSRRQRWVVYRSMFRFWHEREVITKNPIIGIRPVKLNGDVRQGPYTEAQIAAIFAAVLQVDVTSTNIGLEEKKVYAVRLHAFLTLLLHTGCDVVDAVLFDKANLTSQTVRGKEVCVYRYHREKTGKPAIIPLPSDVARILQDVPMLECNPENMPFRCEGERQADVQLWQRRVKHLLTDAGVKWVDLPRNRDGKGRRKAANVKQFRHTFAIRQLVAGQREETVARMMGHSDTKMVQSHYGAWVKERDDAHIAEILAIRG